MTICHCERCDEPDPVCEHGVSTHVADCETCKEPTSASDRSATMKIQEGLVPCVHDFGCSVCRGRCATCGEPWRAAVDRLRAEITRLTE